METISDLKIKLGPDSHSVNQLVRAIWGDSGWRVMHHAPCKNGNVWIVTDCKRNVWDLAKWDREEWTSERGIEMNMTHCKPLSIGANAEVRNPHPK